jgi:cyanate lyase
MAKKAISQTPAVVQHAEVSNNINLNLNQNDLIDLAIQENLEVLEGKLKAVKEELETKKKLTEQLKKDAAKGIAQKALKKDPAYTKLTELFVILGVKSEGEESIDNNSYGHYSPYQLCGNNTQENYIGEFSGYNHEDYPNLAAATRSIYKGTWYKNSFTQVSVDLRYNQDGLNVNFHKTLILDPKDTKDLGKVLEPLENRMYELHKLKFDLQKEFFEYTFGEKRIKAKIVKASLKKTAEGQAILGMLQGATGVKLIG